jgi:hypothetical protein
VLGHYRNSVVQAAEEPAAKAAAAGEAAEQQPGRTASGAA